MSEWQTMQFDQAVLINPSVPLIRDRVYPFVDMQAVDPATRDVRAHELREFKASGSRFSCGDTLLARITPCLENGKIARYVAALDEPHAHGSTEFIVIRGRPNVTDSAFAYYLTKWDGVRNYCISQMTGSSGRQRVPTSALSHLEVAIPPLREQQAIACILGALDDKIELNRRRNRTLEAMARAIFQSWFIDFDPVKAKAAVRKEHPNWTNEQISRAACPKLKHEIAALFPDRFEDSPLGPIPAGWRVGNLGEVADNPRRGINAEEIKSGTPYIALEHMPRRSISLTDWTTADAIESNKFEFHQGEILFGKLRPYFHKVGIAPVDGVCSTDILVIVPK
jgi:type I restriction enzyme S subunit